MLHPVLQIKQNILKNTSSDYIYQFGQLHDQITYDSKDIKKHLFTKFKKYTLSGVLSGVLCAYGSITTLKVDRMV